MHANLQDAHDRKRQDMKDARKMIDLSAFDAIVDRNAIEAAAED